MFMKMPRAASLLVMFWVASLPVFAQQPPVPGARANAALTKLFGGHKAFPAKASVQKVSSFKGQFKIKRTALGRATVDGRATVKPRVTITDGKGEKQEAITCNAADLQDFPIKLQTTGKKKTIMMVCREVSFNRPDATESVAPQGFKRHTNLQV